MRITCPYCGTRNLDEFTYRGPIASRRPIGMPGSTTSICGTIRPVLTKSSGITARAVTPGSKSRATRPPMRSLPSIARQKCAEQRSAEER